MTSYNVYLLFVISLCMSSPFFYFDAWRRDHIKSLYQLLYLANYNIINKHSSGMDEFFLVFINSALLLLSLLLFKEHNNITYQIMYWSPRWRMSWWNFWNIFVKSSKEKMHNNTILIHKLVSALFHLIILYSIISS